MKRSRALVAVTAALTAAVLSTPTAATASPVVSDPIATGLAGPLQIAVSGHRVYVGQDFAGVLTKIRADGSTKDLTAQPGEVAGVAVRGFDVAFTFNNMNPDDPVSSLMLRRANGTIRTIADLQSFEATRNPDHRNVYGFLGLSKECADQVPAEIPGGHPYHGLVDSHAYSLANAPDGGWYVGEAGGNAILKVERNGRVKVVAVLPPQKVKVTADIAAGVGLPDCVIGKSYAFEPVPTDVEVGWNGSLVVSLLPGGPEDASLGARGSVVRVWPGGGMRTVAKGFLGATNVALGTHGRIYVAEMFGNRISVIDDGHVHAVADVPTPASIEFANGMLYASVDVFAAGSIVTIKP